MKCTSGRFRPMCDGKIGNRMQHKGSRRRRYLPTWCVGCVLILAGCRSLGPAEPVLRAQGNEGSSGLELPRFLPPGTGQKDESVRMNDEKGRRMNDEKGRLLSDSSLILHPSSLP